MKTNKEERLTLQTAKQIAEAYARLTELRKPSIVTTNTEAEVKGLVEFLSDQLLRHADELLASWVAIKQEYEPVLHLLARVGLRVSGIQTNILKKQDEKV